MSRPIASSKNWRYRKDSANGAGVGPAVVILLLVAALTAWYIWVFWVPPRLAPFVRVLCVEQYPSQQTQLPFLRNDLTALAETFGADATSLRSGVRTTLGGGTFDIHLLKSETELSALGPYLGQLAEANARDIAIIYIAAHGVAFDENAYLVGSASNLERAEQLCRVDRVLQAIHQIHDGAKLILLDAGNLPANLRAGMPVNQFVFRLHQAVQALDDEKLWLICSHSLGQGSHGSLARQRSYFSWAVEDAFRELRKEGKRDGVSLYDFYQHVLRHCASHSRTRDNVMQVPLLMRGGTGVVLERHLIELRAVLQEQPVFYRDQIAVAAEEPPEAKQSEPVEKGTPQAAWPPQPAELLALAASSWPLADGSQPPPEPTGSTTRPIQEPQPEVAARQDPEQPPPAGVDANAAAAAAAEAQWETQLQQNPASPQEALGQIWLLIERLQDRDRHPWTPVDFAPNLWRVLLAEVVNLEQQLRFGAEPDPSDARVNLAALKAKLLLLREGMTQQRPIAPGEISSTFRVADRLLSAWNDYLPTLQAVQQRLAGFQPEPRELSRQILALEGRFRDRYFRAGELLRGISRHNALDPELGASEVARLLDELESQLASETFGAPEIDLAPAAKARREEADQALARSEDAVWQILWQQLERADDRHSERFERQYLLTSLLQLTVLPTSRSRIPHVDREHQLTRVAVWKRLDTTIAAQAADLGLTQQDWPQTLAFGSIPSTAEYRLYAHWLGRVRPATSLPASLPQLSFQTDASGDATGQACREVGIQMAQALAGLIAESPRDELDAWRTALLADRYDLSEQTAQNELQFAAALPLLKPVIPPEVIRLVEFPSEISLDQETKRQFVFEIRGGARSKLPVELVMSDADRKRVRVRGVDGSEPSRLELAIQDGKALLDLVFEAAPNDRADGEFAELEIAIPGTPQSHVVRIIPPRPDRIWLIVEQQFQRELPAGDRLPDDSGSTLVLQPFSNFDSRFRFYLENQAGREQKVQVAFHPVALVDGLLPTAFDAFRPGRYTHRGGIDSRFKQAIEQAIARGTLAPFFRRDDLVLQPHGQSGSRQAIDFSPPKPPPGVEGAAPPPETIPDIGLDHGMVVHVRVETESGPRDRFYWIEFSRISSDQLFQPPEASYDKINRRFRVTLTADANKFDLNQLFSWRCEATSHRAPAATFEPGALRKEIAFEIPAEVALAERIDYFDNQVHLTVNGEPRAFVFEINPNESSERRRNVRPEISQVRVLSVEGFDAAGERLPDTRLETSYVFREPQKCQITLAADWPYVGEDLSALQLTLFKPNTPTPENVGPALLSDRQIRFLGRIEGGGFYLQAKVADHVVSRETANWIGVAEFSAELRTEPPSPSPFAIARQRIIFDPIPPEGSLSFFQGDSRLRSTADVGEPVAFRVQCNDEAEWSQVTSVQLIRDMQPNGRVDPDEQPEKEPFRSELGEWRLSQVFKEPGTYQFFARGEDLAGNTAVWGPIELEVKAASPESAGKNGDPAQMAPPKKFRIEVGVALGSKPLDGGKLEGINLAGVETDVQRRGSQLVFAQVPPGTYKLSLTGSAPSGKRIVGEAELVVTDEGKLTVTMEGKPVSSVVMKFE